ncbi:hypothetical protein A3Q56_07989 [Intoshia linei]|uniref:CHCH domain-containing protein n=1 Tax=Intoshia linei TaxID=1819745 RepID=A0A177AQN0_9BILA|nr:hypothetical protein A3Q56_07989 [Intoshia linei]
MINSSGCAKFHLSLQDCYMDHKDWRKCKTEMINFNKCMNNRQI